MNNGEIPDPQEIPEPLPDDNPPLPEPVEPDVPDLPEPEPSDPAKDWPIKKPEYP